MQRLYLLISPRILALRNAIISTGPRERKRAVIMGSVGLAFWALMFILSTRVLLYFQSVEVIGDILAHHLLAMVLLTFFSLLIFSHIITALSNLYLSSDLEIYHASPAHLEEVFLSRSVYTVIDSSWMVIVFGLPVLLAYAFVYRPSVGYYAALLHMGFAGVIVAACIGILVTMVLVSVFPAQRTRELVILMSLFVLVCLYLLFRFLRPERLADPEAFFSAMQYVSALKAPDSPYLPTHWVTETLWAYLIRAEAKGHLFNAFLLWSTAVSLTFINLWVAGAVYFEGFSKSQEGKKRRGGRRALDVLAAVAKRPLEKDQASVMDKDIRIFFRDNTQWPQMLLLGALVVVYLYNFSALPLERIPVHLPFLQNEIAFLNMGLAGFVLSAVSVRFIFPSVSSEGEAFWIVRSSPISMGRFLWSKYALAIAPMLFLGEVLTIFTNRLLHVTLFVMIVSSVTMFLAVFGIVALAVGLGAVYPNFKCQSIAQVSTGFGGLIYMIYSAIFIGFIIVLEAGPVYLILMSHLRGTPISSLQWVFIVSSFIAVLVLNGIAVYKPMRMGLEALVHYE